MCTSTRPRQLRLERSRTTSTRVRAISSLPWLMVVPRWISTVVVDSFFVR
jgi:hypothetical protein